MDNLVYFNSHLFYTNPDSVYSKISKILKCSIFGAETDSSYILLPTCKSEIPLLKPTAEIDVLIDNRVNSFNNHSFLSWSGGIDSTAMVVAFIKNKKRDDFTVCYTETSINENQEFYSFLKRENYNLLDISNYNTEIFKCIQEGEFILGQYLPGDSINKDSIVEYNGNCFCRDFSPNVGLEQILREKEDFYCDLYKVLECPFELITFWDLYLFLQIKFKPLIEKYICFQFVKDFNIYTKYKFFYDSSIYYSWILNNKDTLFANEYKYFLKSYIFSEIDRRYFSSMCKVNSRIFPRYVRDKVLAIFSSGKIVFSDKNNYLSYANMDISHRLRLITKLLQNKSDCVCLNI